MITTEVFATANAKRLLSEQSLVSIRGLEKRFGSYTALQGITLDVKEHEILTLLGPSGCGKSTLMRIIAGFEPPTSGQLLLRGEDLSRIPPERRPINMVFQRYALFPHLDVFDNIAFGLRIKRLPEHEVRKKVLAMMDMVQLKDMAGRWITQISGGQSQRVALARALINEPEVLLLDEPLAALDLKIRQLMLTELKRIHETTGTTFVYVTHDQDEAMLLSSRVALMDHGKIEQIGTPDDLYFRPVSLFAAKFLGETNIIAGRLTDGGSGTMVAEFSGGRTELSNSTASRDPGSNALLSVRPEAIEISAAQPLASDRPNGCTAILRSINPIGGRVVFVSELGDGTVVRAQRARIGVEDMFRNGQQVYLTWKPEAVNLLRS